MFRVFIVYNCICVPVKSLNFIQTFVSLVTCAVQIKLMCHKVNYQVCTAVYNKDTVIFSAQVLGNMKIFSTAFLYRLILKRYIQFCR